VIVNVCTDRRGTMKAVCLCPESQRGRIHPTRRFTLAGLNAAFDADCCPSRDDLALAADRAAQKARPIGNRHRRAVLRDLGGDIGLGLVAAALAPHDEPHLGSERPAQGVKGLPSCQFTPCRSWKVSSVKSAFQDHLVASSDVIVSSRFCGTSCLKRTRLLKTAIIAFWAELSASS
jgi:hypothetical protein